MLEEIAIPDDLPANMTQMIRSSGKIRRVVVDRSACIGARSCVLVGSKTFQMDDENLAYTLPAPGDDEETILLAAQSCPVLAIYLYDADGKKLFP